MLCYKLSYAAKKGIKVVHSVTAGLEGIENVDCCNLIGNLIDNAIEANLKLPEGKRKLELFIKGDPCKLFIRVRNILETSVLDTNSGLATQKKIKMSMATASALSAKSHPSTTDTFSLPKKKASSARK